MKRVLLALWFLPIFTARFCAFSQTHGDYQLLWRVSGEGLPADSYLFGTLHLKQRAVFRLPDSLYIALDTCEQFAMEVTPEAVAKRLWRSATASDRGPRLSTLLDSATFRRLDSAYRHTFRLSLSELRQRDLLDRLPARLLEPEAEPKDGPLYLDTYLSQLARQWGKPVRGLERPGSSASGPTSRPALAPASIPSYLQHLLQQKSHWRARADSMVQLYQAGHLTELHELVNPGANEQQDSAMLRRNLAMSRRIEQLIRHQGTFIAVGAAHLGGSQGLINLLRHRGYRLTAVPATYTGLSARYRTAAPDTSVWQVWHPANLGVKLSVPSHPVAIQYPDMPPTSRMYLAPAGQERLFMMMGYFPQLDRAPWPSQRVAGEDWLAQVLEHLHLDEEWLLATWESISDGPKGYALRLTHRTEEQTLRVRLFVRRGHIYWFGVWSQGRAEAPLAARRFFDSIAWLPFPKVDPSAWQWVDRPSLGARVLFPGRPRHQQRTTPMQVRPRDSVFSEVAVLEDVEQDMLFMFTTNHYPANFHFQHDSLALRHLCDGLIRGLKGAPDQVRGDSMFWLARYPALRSSFTVADRSQSAQVQAVIRGNRVYLLVAMGPDQSAFRRLSERFMGSFSILPYRLQAAEWGSWCTPEGDFTAVLPRGPETRTSLAEAVGTEVKALFATGDWTSVRDTLNHVSYNLIRYELNPFAYLPTHDSLFSLVRRTLSQDPHGGAQVEWQQDTLWQGWPTRRLKLSFPHMHQHLMAQITLAGQKLYLFFAFLPPPLAGASLVREAFHSVRLAEDIKAPRWRLENYKLRETLHALTEADSQQRTLAFKALLDRPLVAADTAILLWGLSNRYRSLPHAYPFEPVPLALAKALEDLAVPSRLPIVAELVRRYQDQDELQLLLIRHLILSERSAWQDSACQLLLTLRPKPQGDFQAQRTLRHLYPQAHMARWWPAMGRLLSTYDWQPALLNWLQVVLEAGWLRLDTLPQLRQQIDRVGEQFANQLAHYEGLEARFPDSKWTFPHWRVEDYLALTPYLEPTAERLTVLRRMLTLGTPALQIEVLKVWPLSLDALPHGLLLGLAQQRQWRAVLYRILQQRQATGRMPAPYQVRDSLVVSLFYRELEFQGNGQSQVQIEIVGRYPYRLAQGRRWCFLLRFRKPGATQWSPGLIGVWKNRWQAWPEDLWVDWHSEKALGSQPPRAWVEQFMGHYQEWQRQFEGSDFPLGW